MAGPGFSWSCFQFQITKTLRPISFFSFGNTMQVTTSPRLYASGHDGNIKKVPLPGQAKKNMARALPGLDREPALPPIASIQPQSRFESALDSDPIPGPPVPTSRPRSCDATPLASKHFRKAPLAPRACWDVCPIARIGIPPFLSICALFIFRVRVWACAKCMPFLLACAFRSEYSQLPWLASPSFPHTPHVHTHSPQITQSPIRNTPPLRKTEREILRGPDVHFG